MTLPLERAGLDNENMMNNYGQSDHYNQWYHPDGRPAISSEERAWAMAAHLSAIIAMVVSAGWLSFVGPLLVWLIKKDTSPYVRRAAAQSFNFNLGMALMTIAGWLFILTLIGIPIGVLLIAGSFLLMIWHHLRATFATSRDEYYRYPFQFRLLD